MDQSQRATLRQLLELTQGLLDSDILAEGSVGSVLGGWQPKPTTPPPPPPPAPGPGPAPGPSPPGGFYCIHCGQFNPSPF